jgi:hypothetical protein
MSKLVAGFIFGLGFVPLTSRREESPEVIEGGASRRGRGSE